MPISFGFLFHGVLFIQQVFKNLTNTRASVSRTDDFFLPINLLFQFSDHFQILVSSLFSQLLYFGSSIVTNSLTSPRIFAKNGGAAPVPGCFQMRHNCCVFICGRHLVLYCPIESAFAQVHHRDRGAGGAGGALAPPTISRNLI